MPTTALSSDSPLASRERPAPAAAAGPAAALCGVPVRRQRVKVPMRLVTSPFYADIALAVYVKVKALGMREEGCQAKSATIASYLHLSKASVERGLAQLSRPAPDQVVELLSQRRTLRGGQGTSALRRTRPMSRTETFVWVPVAAAEDLTPRQLRAYAIIAYAQAVGIQLTEGELAGSLFHHSGEKAGQQLTATAAGQVVDELETARWLTVRRRAGARGRHLFTAHDIAPAAAPGEEEVSGLADPASGDDAEQARQEQAGILPAETDSPPVGEGSGPLADEGSLANEETLRTDRPEDTGALGSPAVGEIQVVEGAAPVENPPVPKPRNRASAALALRADAHNQPVIPKPTIVRSTGSRGAYSGPQLTLSPEIYAVLEPVHWLLKRVDSAFVARKIAREVGRQLREGMAAERISHRLAIRAARTMVSEIRDPGRWLLGVALPRWGCGHQDCESGVMWSTGQRCDVCAEVVADRAAARQRSQRLAEGLCPEHGTRPGPAGSCTDCALDDAIRRPVPAPRTEPAGPPRGTCSGCGARIFLIGQALVDGSCRLCRSEMSGLPQAVTRPSCPTAEPVPCIGGADGALCDRPALPARSVCVRHRIVEIAAAAV
ncbi:hypothetical protein [Streptomyces sp. NRRL S-350]|uniref:hypothetical protein n=1 Tax=Streptomyces sp. NRRL S-350 TaxID=1463902 RepID=UPI001F48445A|nr:hypothetical protein [Streptomyces sp. NRRL S-350]